MTNEINNIIQQAIREDWFNLMTTGDLQGVCEAQAMKMLGYNPDYLKVMAISDVILEGIYKHQESEA
jgi:hypothetical protein